MGAARADEGSQAAADEERAEASAAGSEGKGLTIIATKLYINEKGIAKLVIALAKGKKVYDKRQSIKEKDIRREMERGE